MNTNGRDNQRQNIEDKQDWSVRVYPILCYIDVKAITSFYSYVAISPDVNMRMLYHWNQKHKLFIYRSSKYEF